LFKQNNNFFKIGRLKFCYLYIYLFFSALGYSQTILSDFDQIAKKDFTDTTYKKKNKATYVFKNNNAFVKYNPLSLAFGGALLFYQSVISKQIMMGCAFNPSCSNFSKQSIKMYGVVKGVALSTDRLTRCTKLSSIDFHPILFDDNGKVNDYPIYYTLKH